MRQFFKDVLDSGDYIVVQEMFFPYTEMGHTVVIVDYESDKGFKIKTTDADEGQVEWIPLNQMTWFQCSVTEKDLKAVRKYTSGNFDETDREEIIERLKSWHKSVTKEELCTDFTQRTGKRLVDFGFVLKFNKTCHCVTGACKIRTDFTF